MKTQAILQHVEAEAQERRMTVLFASESGSRAWGFPSTNSDYDVRAIFARRVETYLSLHSGKDAYDVAEKDDIDLSFWDIRKACHLLMKGNCAIQEHLASPIWYINVLDFGEELTALAADYFNPKAAIYHHLSLAGGMWSKYFDRGARERAIRKKYLYVLRSIACAEWIHQKRSMYPMKFMDVLGGIGASRDIVQVIERLVQDKGDDHEMGEMPADPALTKWIATTLDDLDKKALITPVGNGPGPDPLDRIITNRIMGQGA